MAVRKTGTRKTTARRTTKKAPLKKGAGNRTPPLSAAFRIFLLIVIIIAFFTVLPIIKNLRLNAKVAETEQGTENRERDEEDEVKKPATPVTKEPEKKPQAEKPVPAAQPSSPQPAQSSAPPAQPSTSPVQPAPAAPQPSAPAAQPPSPQPVKPPVETRDRSIYLMQKSNMMLVKVNRNLNVSNTPLQDSVNALLAGPAPDEIMRGIESLVPEGSRLLSARVEGTTAVLDFNQEFRYNTRGSEGCAAQIKQIVWTATEFPNVRDVQFLIEGQKVDFLSEGVTIRSPIGR